MHARGAGAYGYFKVFDDRASKYTYAPVLTDPSRKTPVFVRFSTVQGSRGSAVRPTFVELLQRSLSCLDRTPFETCAASPPSFTPKKEIGISSGTISPFSLYRNRSSFLTLFMPSSPSPTTRSRRVKVRTTISGTLLVCSRKVKQLRVSGFPSFCSPSHDQLPTWSCGPCLIERSRGPSG